MRRCRSGGGGGGGCGYGCGCGGGRGNANLDTSRPRPRPRPRQRQRMGPEPQMASSNATTTRRTITAKETDPSSRPSTYSLQTVHIPRGGDQQHCRSVVLSFYPSLRAASFRFDPRRDPRPVGFFLPAWHAAAKASTCNFPDDLSHSLDSLDSLLTGPDLRRTCILTTPHPLFLFSVFRLRFFLLSCSGFLVFCLPVFRSPPSAGRVRPTLPIRIHHLTPATLPAPFPTNPSTLPSFDTPCSNRSPQTVGPSPFT